MPYQDDDTREVYKITVNTYSVDNVIMSINYFRKDIKEHNFTNNVKPVNDEHIKFYTLLEEELNYRANDTSEFDICEEIVCLIEEMIEDDEDSEINTLFKKFYE
tara:strand:- start:49 stop:360 length:312 start_codon:yes stop_codon:yes gene_type:complete